MTKLKRFKRKHQSYRAYIAGAASPDHRAYGIILKGLKETTEVVELAQGGSMVLHAAFICIGRVPSHRPLRIVSDCEWFVEGAREDLARWASENWLSRGKPIEHADDWKILWTEIEGRKGPVKFRFPREGDYRCHDLYLRALELAVMTKFRPKPKRRKRRYGTSGLRFYPLYDKPL